MTLPPRPARQSARRFNREFRDLQPEISRTAANSGPVEPRISQHDAVPYWIDESGHKCIYRNLFDTTLLKI